MRDSLTADREANAIRLERGSFLGVFYLSKAQLINFSTVI